MRLELGTRVDCVGETFGRLVDVVIDPTSRRVTHLVVESDGEEVLARLVPVGLAEAGDGSSEAVVLRATAEELRRLPPVREVAYLRLGDFPLDDADWDVGVEEVLALPYYPTYHLEPEPVDFKIRRASAVTSSDERRLGDVDGFVVGASDQITHLVLERGHPWDKREIAIPIGAVARVETDEVRLSLTREEVNALPPVEVRRWPHTIEPGIPRR
jgi:hypothetical protein